FLGLLDRLALLEDLVKVAVHGRGICAEEGADQLLLGALFGPLERDGQDERRAASDRVVRVALAAAVFDVVPDLIGDAERLAVFPQDLVRLVVGAAQERAQAQRDFERRRRLLAEDLEHLERSERSGVPRPAEFLSLA